MMPTLTGAHGAAVGRGGPHRLGEDRVGLEQRLPGSGADHVGQHLREVRPRALALLRRIGLPVDVETIAGDLREIGQAVVEFVVADRAAVELRGVHHLVDRQRLVAGNRLDQRLVVGQRGALDGVAVVEQQVVRILLAGRRDQRGDALEADRTVGRQLEVVVGQHVGVEVGGFQQRERGARAGRRLGLGGRRAGGRRRVIVVAAGRQAGGGKNGGGREHGRACRKNAQRRGEAHRNVLVVCYGGRETTAMAPSAGTACKYRKRT